MIEVLVFSKYDVFENIYGFILVKEFVEYLLFCVGKYYGIFIKLWVEVFLNFDCFNNEVIKEYKDIWE